MSGARAFVQAEGAGKWMRKLEAESKFLDDVLAGHVTMKPEHVTGSNLTHMAAVLASCQHETPVNGVERRFASEGGSVQPLPVCTKISFVCCVEWPLMWDVVCSAAAQVRGMANAMQGWAASLTHGVGVRKAVVNTAGTG
jgi:hypothetical protein